MMKWIAVGTVVALAAIGAPDPKVWKPFVQVADSAPVEAQAPTGTWYLMEIDQAKDGKLVHRDPVPFDDPADCMTAQVAKLNTAWDIRCINPDVPDTGMINVIRPTPLYRPQHVIIELRRR